MPLTMGQYFEQHEYLELAWNEETRAVRDVYQGILQVGVAFLQMERGNRRGALKMFRRGLPKLRGVADVCQGIRVEAFRAASEQIHRELSDQGPGEPVLASGTCFPKVEFDNPYDAATPEDLGIILPGEGEEDSA